MNTYNVSNTVFRAKDIIMIEIEIVPAPKEFQVHNHIQIDIEQIVTQRNIYFVYQ